MNEKVKVTKKEAEIIEKIKNTGLMNTKLSQALEHGYEVEPRFEVGDWVVEPINQKVGKISEIKRDGVIIVDDTLWYLANHVRHATESEASQEVDRRKWGKIGRKPDEYHHYDIAYDLLFYTYVEVDDPSAYGGKTFRVANLDDKSDSREISPYNLTLVCPAEKRFDHE